MRRYKDEISRLMVTFFEATGIAAIGVDAQLNIVLCCPNKGFLIDFAYIAINQLSSFLSSCFTNKPDGEHPFYTFILENNFLCNIALVVSEGAYCGAIVTEPMLVNMLSSTEIEVLLSRYGLTMKAKNALKSSILTAKVASYDRIRSLGTILSSLVQSFCEEQSPQQILQGSAKPTNGALLLRKVRMTECLTAKRPKFASQSVYLQVKKSIQNGNAEELSGIMNEIIADNMPMEQLCDVQFIRSMKNSFVRACAMGSFAAIEANAPYAQAMEVSSEFIRQMETQENASEIFALMKNTFLAFARMVSLSNGSIYSKPVRQVIDYIQDHFSEKITLERLAEHTGLSACYLSNIIKKETGLALLDNINKVRIEKSRQLLLDKNSTVLDVAQRVGFTYQNHFAAVFKKINKVTPTDYRRFMGLEHRTKSGDKSICMLPPGLIEQAYNLITMFSDFYDVVRIVEPISRQSWIIQSNDDSLLSGTCYNFWGRREYCDSCVAIKAYLDNGAAFKVESKGDQHYMVLAVPKAYGESTYVIEALKGITKENFMGIDTAVSYEAPTPVLLSNDECTGMYSRTYIDKNLPVAMRSHTLKGLPLSLIVVTINVLQQDAAGIDSGDYDSMLREFADSVKGSIRSGIDWVGRYGGNIFLIVLDNTDYSKAVLIAKRIKDIFERNTAERMNEGIICTVNFGIQALSDDITEADAFIRAAFISIGSKVLE